MKVFVLCKLVRVAHPTQGFLIAQKPILGTLRKEGGASFPSRNVGVPAPPQSWIIQRQEGR
jgi:hypothetical protein